MARDSTPRWIVQVRLLFAAPPNLFGARASLLQPTRLQLSSAQNPQTLPKPRAARRMSHRRCEPTRSDAPDRVELRPQSDCRQLPFAEPFSSARRLPEIGRAHV